MESIRVKLAKCASLKAAVESIHEIFDFMLIDFSYFGIRFQAAERNFNTCVILKVNREEFEYYYCAEYVRVPIRFGSLLNLMKFIDGNESMTISISFQPDTICFGFESENREKIFHFHLALFRNISRTIIDVPAFPFSCVFNIPTRELATLIKNLSRFGETIYVVLVGNKVIFRAKSSAGSVRVTYKSSNNVAEAAKVTASQPMMHSYSAGHMTRLLSSAFRVSEMASVSFHDNNPLQISLQITPGISLRFCILPIAAGKRYDLDDNDCSFDRELM